MLAFEGLLSTTSGWCGSIATTGGGSLGETQHLSCTATISIYRSESHHVSIEPTEKSSRERVNDRFLNMFRYKSESTDMDFKSARYRFKSGTETDKSELLKYILTIANSWRDGTGYLLLRFKDHQSAFWPFQKTDFSTESADCSLSRWLQSTRR